MHNSRTRALTCCRIYRVKGGKEQRKRETERKKNARAWREHIEKKMQKIEEGNARLRERKRKERKIRIMSESKVKIMQNKHTQHSYRQIDTHTTSIYMNTHKLRVKSMR